MTDAELNGHLDTAEELHDYLRAGIDKVMSFGGETGGKLEDFAQSLRVVLDANATLATLRVALAEALELLSTPWTGEPDNAPTFDEKRKTVMFTTGREAFIVSRKYATELGAALLRAAVREELTK